MKNILLFSFFLLLFNACDDPLPSPNKFVIEAFLFAGEPIDDIYIKTTFPISEEDDISEPVSDAEVILYKEGTPYTLVPSDSAGFYHYPNTDLTVETGDVFSLEVNYDGATATAETTVPTPTIGVNAMPDTLFYPTVPLFGVSDEERDSINAILGTLFMTATWDNPNGDYYYLVVENIEDVGLPIFPSLIANILERFQFVSEPSDDNNLTLLGVGLTTFGTHRVRVYHINQEYLDLFLNQEQDSRDLNEPPTNITGALGIFSAFNSGEAFFEAARL